MSYSVNLYVNSSNVNVMNKAISLKATTNCEFKAPMSVDRPTIYISATDSYDDVNYIYIPEFKRYYYARCTGGTSQTLTFECVSDPLMSFKGGILSSPAVIARNPWHYDKYVPDNLLPLEARTVRDTFKFHGDYFNGNNNCFVLTTIGHGGQIVPNE